jgi:hypothetical protein
MQGDWLFPTEDNLLYYGFFVLAAARERRFWQTWMEMLAVSEDGLEGWFGLGRPRVCTLNSLRVSPHPRAISDPIGSDRNAQAFD